MKNFWIAACISSIGILMGVIVFAGVFYGKVEAENRRAVETFLEIPTESTKTSPIETSTANNVGLLVEINSANGARVSVETNTNSTNETGLSIETKNMNNTNHTGLVIEANTANGLKKETENEDVKADAERKTDAEETESDKRIRLLFSGDIYLSDTFLSAYDVSGVGGILDNEVLGLMTESDITMVNQEFAFSNRGTPMEDKQYTFRVPPERARIFQEMGVDIVSLANNHALDFGKVALEDSFETLDRAEILYAGAGTNLSRAKEMQTVTVNGKVIGFLAASRVIPVAEWNAGSASTGMLTTYSPDLLCRTIEENREKCDYLVVFVHWGEERNTYPEEYQFRMGKQYIDAGADAVIGCHSHVMQGIEYYQGKPIAYSLGNYIFNLRSASTGLLQLVIEENGDVSAQLIPVRTDALPFRFLTKEEKKEFYQYMESISFQISIDEDGKIRYNR